MQPRKRGNRAGQVRSELIRESSVPSDPDEIPLKSLLFGSEIACDETHTTCSPAKCTVNKFSRCATPCRASRKSGDLFAAHEPPHIRRESIRGSPIPSHSNRYEAGARRQTGAGPREAQPGTGGRGNQSREGPGTRGGLQRVSRVSEVPVHQYTPVHTSTPVHCTGTSTSTRILVLVLVHRPLGYVACPNTGIGKY